MSIRALHLSSGNLYGGVERIISSLAEFSALCPSMVPLFALSFDGRQADELRELGSDPHLLGAVRLSRPASVLRAGRALDRVLDQLTPDVVVCHNPWSLLVFGPRLLRRRIPVVLWVHGALTGANWLERVARLIRPALVIANSHFTRTTVRSVFPSVPTVVVYPPGQFRGRDDGRRAAVRKSMAVADDRVLILQVSRIEAGKGHRLHLEALAALRGLPGWEAWFAGGAQRPQEQVLLADLERVADDLGVKDRVRFLGERRDVADLLAAADVFCQPNAAPDAFGLAFVEALAASLPVVTTRLGGAVEVVTESCGYLVSPGDKAELVAALTRLLGDPHHRRQLGAAGPARADWLCNPVQRLGDLRDALASVVVPRPTPAKGVRWSR